MRQATYSLFEAVVLALAILGAILLLKEILELLFPEPMPAPVVNVTVNMPTPPKELTAGDHAKGIFKIGWDKCVEGLVTLHLLGK